jgi:hypothetical protein
MALFLLIRNAPDALPGLLMVSSGERRRYDHSGATALWHQDRPAAHDV